MRFLVIRNDAEALEPAVQESTIGYYLFVPNVEEVMHRLSRRAQRKLIQTRTTTMVTDKGMFKNPFGHYWQNTEKNLNEQLTCNESM